MMALMYALMAFIPNLETMIPLFIGLFGVSFFFVNFGPNTTTFLIPSEIYPTSIRARAHGISAAIGKLGAFTGAFLVPFMLKKIGVFSTMGFMSAISVLGMLVTIIIPEMRNKSLSDTET
jgi:PHS family inorganic phosphate transporter-like MFS transporter